jgi:HAMP domain-containing protein
MPNASATPEFAQVNDVIDKLQTTLDDARGLPNWGVTLVVVVALLSFVILLHVLAVVTLGPCLWAIWIRRKRMASVRLPSDEDVDASDTAPTPDTAADESSDAKGF